MYISRIIHFNFYILFHRHTFSFVIHYFILINSHLNIFFLFYYSIPTTRGWNQPMFLLRHSSWFWFQEYRDKNSIKSLLGVSNVNVNLVALCPSAKQLKHLHIISKTCRKFLHAGKNNVLSCFLILSYSYTGHTVTLLMRFKY